MVQNPHAGEQKSHWEKINKGDYHINDVSLLFGLSQCFLLSSKAVLYHVNE